MEKNHDIAVERAGVFREAIEGIKAAKAAGFQVCTNTTVYKETDMAEIEELFEYLKQLKVDGHQIAPAYGYSAVDDREIFLTREDVHEKFKDIDRLAKKYAIRQTPIYLEFLKGERELPCTAWGNPTYNVKGGKALLPDHRWPLQDFRRVDDPDALGVLRAWQRSALRALHGSLRVRTFGGAGDQCGSGR